MAGNCVTDSLIDSASREHLVLTDEKTFADLDIVVVDYVDNESGPVRKPYLDDVVISEVEEMSVCLESDPKGSNTVLVLD